MTVNSPLIGAIPLPGSVAGLSAPQQTSTVFSLNCSASDNTVNECTYSMPEVCSGSVNAGLRCLGSQSDTYVVKYVT